MERSPFDQPGSDLPDSYPDRPVRPLPLAALGVGAGSTAPSPSLRSASGQARPPVRPAHDQPVEFPVSETAVPQADGVP